MGWVFPLHGDARTLCRVGDEARELVERPSSDQAVVFAGFRPTAGACRAPADTGEPFQADDSPMTALRRAPSPWGACPDRTWQASSPSLASRPQCPRFSLCP